MNFQELRDLVNIDSGEQRPIRLRFSPEHAHLSELLIAKRIEGCASICGSFEYQLICLSIRPGLPLAGFLAIPIEIQLVTDRGTLTSVCGIIDSAAEGQCDGGFASYRLILRDALSIMRKRVNTRVFIQKNELDITHILVSEWRRTNPVMGACFRLRILCRFDAYRLCEFVMQPNESDAAFLERLWKRRGIGWFFTPIEGANGSAIPSHMLTLFDDSYGFAENSAGQIRYHRAGGKEERDCIDSWSAVSRIQPGVVTRSTWHPYSATQFGTTALSHAEQAPVEREVRTSLDDHRIDPPNANLYPSEYHDVSYVRLLQHDYERNAFYGESDVRDLAVGEWNEVTGHHELDCRSLKEREFVVTSLRVEADNNLPIALSAALFRAFDQHGGGARLLRDPDGASRYRNTFCCVRRGTPIIPAYDPTTDLPTVHPTIAVAVCLPGQEMYSNECGWIRIRIPGCRVEDHQHAAGAGSSGTASDSAWVPVAGPWSGQGYGFKGAFRDGDTVLLSFLGGNPDCPVVLGAIHSQARPPVAFSDVGVMPDNQALSGLKSREIGGQRHNQLRLDDTPGQISAQLSSGHGKSELNLGFLTHPRNRGHGKPRGEGAELRSDGSVALRGACGVLISADARVSATGGLLDRDKITALAATLQQVQAELDALSEAHGVPAADLAPMAAMVDNLKTWSDGSNVDPKKAQTALHKPVIAIDAPAGLAAASGDNILLGAQSNIDLVSIRDTHISSGRKLLMRALKGLSLMSHTLGMKLVSASGKLTLEAHQDDVEITAAKRIVLAASEEIILQAPKITILAQGAQSIYGSGALTHQVSGKFTAKYARADFGGSADGQPPEIPLPSSEVRHNQRVVISDMTTGVPLAHKKYKVTLEDGNVIQGTTDVEGLTENFDSSIPFGSFNIELLDDE